MRVNLNKNYPVLAILLLTFLQTLFFLLADIKLLLDLIPDDAAYYFEIAQNFTRGYGFSFDTIHQTNGFQPLWQYFLIIIYSIWPAEAEAFYRIVLIIQTITISLSAFVLYSTLENEYGKQRAVSGLSIFILLVFTQSANGMESAFVVLTLILLYRYTSAITFSVRKYFVTGVLTGLLLLSRLDFLFLPGIFFLIFILRREWKHLLASAAGFILISFPYMVTNYLYTGHSGPISGVLKSGFPRIIFNLDFNFTITGFIAVAGGLLLSVLYIVKNSQLLRDSHFNVKKQLLFSLSLTIIFHFSFYSLFIKWPVLNYYFFFYGVFIALAAADLITIRITQWLSTLLLIFISIFIISKEVSRLNKNLEVSWHAQTYDAAQWVKKNTPSNAVFAMKDAGNFSFLSGRKVINLDGLVNDYMFQEYLKGKQLNEYLRTNNVSYYVLYESSGSEKLINSEYSVHSDELMSYMYMEKSDPIIVKAETEVYRKLIGTNSVLIIWKIN